MTKDDAYNLHNNLKGWATAANWNCIRYQGTMLAFIYNTLVLPQIDYEGLAM